MVRNPSIVKPAENAPKSKNNSTNKKMIPITKLGSDKSSILLFFLKRTITFN